mmetsp:Transcript_105551/g.207034  ORF Transcript_105551/g.207034 Transcript_105551/m.207034 type:complete len:702 (+) Transcript_105551:86-2191(+)
MAPQSTLNIWLLGGMGLLSVSVLCYFMFWRAPNNAPAIKDGKDSKSPASKSPNTSSKTDAKPSATKKVESKPLPEVVVEDAEDESDDEEEIVDAGDAELEALKTKYEDANRIASKYISGNMYEKAVEKLTEALDLAPQVSSSSKDVPTLYNNRSAMYEKLGMFDKSLSDITIILTMDPNHMKARVRRARIFEAQGKLKQAIEDYVYAGLLQQFKQEAPSNQAKVETLVKELAQKSAPSVFKTLRAAAFMRDLPSKSHCKNFLESYPSVHLWIPHYRAQNRAVLEVSLAEVTPSAEASEPQSAEQELLFRQRALDLICHDLVHSRFTEAFELLAKLPVPAAPESVATVNPTIDTAVPLQFLCLFEHVHRSNADILLSIQFEMIGFDKHLRCDLTGAIEAYQRSLQYYPNNVDAQLKLANVYLEVPDLAATNAQFDAILASFSALDESDSVVAVMKAWTLLHRVSIFVTRNESGEYSKTAIADSQRDVDAALALAELAKDTVAGRAVAVTGLVRAIHVIMQSKPMVGETPAEEDPEKCKQLVATAKAINPDNESVLLMEAEILNNEGQTDEALELIKKVQNRPEAIPGDCTFYCLRASILVNKAMLYLQSYGDMAGAQQFFTEASSLYAQGTDVEPNAIELLNQYAQFSSMIGDIPTAVRLLKNALPLARTKDDVQDLTQLLYMNEAQLKAIETIRSSGMTAR